MAVTHHYTLLCEYASRDENHKFVFAGTFVNVELPEMPSASLRFVAAVGFSADIGDRIEVNLVLPNKKKLRLFKTTRKAPAEQLGSSRVAIGTVVVDLSAKYVWEHEGVHFIELKQGKRTVHRRPFGVRRATGLSTEENGK